MTIPYVTGTVSVTAGSAVVTGSGTAWATALIAGGLFGLDSSNGNPVPILSVDSNTQLTLAKPWRGTTAAGQGYWIVRDTAYLQQQTVNAQALSTYIQRLDNAVLAALAGLTPAADKFAYFTGANSGALADIKAKGRDLLSSTTVLDALLKLGPVWGGSVRSPANSDVGLVDGDLNTITVAGVYTLSGNWANTYAGAASVATTGTLVVLQRSANAVFQYFYRDNNQVFRRNTVNGGTSWTDWTIVELPVVGTASNSAGFPAGAIIERGSNANGEYVRFADGTQICWGTGTINVSTALNNHFGSTSGASVTGNALISFPATFSNTNYSVSVFPTFRGFTVLGAYSKNGANAAVRMGVSGSTANDVPYEWSAYGRWF
ncbi:pyocin knob domain-containing protein [Sinorhizobium medicae]|uniref:pyocin knob domain-containing protein n=1 Tax=Sinorhizobium medicae TaxID=110321 RepID=UPI0003FE53D0|nr:pyocin knob domain-containing protein [Sinorhizobium medicae]MDX0506757.1 phage tail protein [Sinorhizobium medicae]MDX0586649.1 phage tail protein [Sinorhizobium medicae]MDX0592647.1 phage tail protein [Sinorhizobium medicae]WQO43950.1 pyocin knob domain-containing protein [Sinorhizobium medicae]WQO44161.1 pyocin knob domain-containing protein [Sinorhizobium medicae]